jgi:hypothetical protein
MGNVEKYEGLDINGIEFGICEVGESLHIPRFFPK